MSPVARKPRPGSPRARSTGTGTGTGSGSGARRHWLVKTEPGSYSIDDLRRDKVTPWTGVRNFQARNTLRDAMSVGDPVLVYHSSAEPMAIVGLAEVASAARPDSTAFDPRDDHFDPKSRREQPTWFVVDLRHVQTFAEPLTREMLAASPELARMELLRRGSRLSVQPVTPAEFEAVMKLVRLHGVSAGRTEAGAARGAPGKATRRSPARGGQQIRPQGRQRGAER